MGNRCAEVPTDRQPAATSVLAQRHRSAPIYRYAGVKQMQGASEVTKDVNKDGRPLRLNQSLPAAI